MLGIAIGVLCLVALARVARGPRHAWAHDRHGARRCGGHGAWGGGPWETPWDADARRARSDREACAREGDRPGEFRRRALHAISRRLDATPGQEKVIAAAMDELRENLRRIREQFQGARHEVAEAIRGETLGDEETNRIFSRFDAHLEAMRTALAAAMQRIHEALDERQRRVLADLVEKGPGLRGWC